MWTISLEYSEQASPSEGARLHKLSADLPFHDTKPPLGVHTIPLEAVHVSLSLTPAPDLSSCAPSHIAASANLSSDENIISDEEMLLTETYENDHVGDNHTHQRDGVSEEILKVARRQRCNKTDTTHGDAMAQEERARANRSLTTACAYLTPPSSQESANEELEPSGRVHDPIVSHTHFVSMDAILSAIDTGLKHVTLGPPNRKAKSSAIVSNEDLKCLSRLAPALWVPGYHQSVSDRAVILPTISHAIANVSTYSSSNASLREKIQQLVSRYPHDTIELSPDDTHKGANHVQTATSAALWQAMASLLHDKTPAKRFQIIPDSTRDDYAEAFEGPEDMLDETTTNADSFRRSEDSDFGDCLETFSELDEEKMCDLDECDDFASELCSLHSCWTEELEPRLPDRWVLRHPSNVDHDSDRVDNGLEFHEKDPCGVDGPGEEGTAGSRRESGRQWDGWYDAHDSMDHELLDVDGDQGEVDELLPPLRSEVVGVEPSIQQHDFTAAVERAEIDDGSALCAMGTCDRTNDVQTGDLRRLDWHDDELLDAAD